MLIPTWLTNFLSFKYFIFCFSLVTLTSCDFISNRIRGKPIVQIEKMQLSTRDFSQELANKLKNLDALSAKDPKILSIFKEQIVNDFIISSLIDLWFTENRLVLSKNEIDQEVQSLVSTYPSDSVFRELLTESEISYAEWVVKIEKTLKRKKLIQTITKDVPTVTEEDLLAFYNENRAKYEQPESVLLAHILISDNNQAEIVKKLLLKQSFSDIAKKYSLAFNSESKDIYGWIEKEYSLGLEKYFKLRIGDIFGPVELPDGIHIFKIIEKKSLKIKSFNEVRTHILSEIMTLRETSKFYAWLDVQLKRYQVKKNLNVLNSVYVETQ